jgi:DNA polymerase III epsilon subunit-like protein
MSPVRRPVYFVVDTETTGLPVFNCDGSIPDPTDQRRFDTSRLIEIAYIIFNEHGTEIERHVSRVVPSGSFKICESAKQIHGLDENEVKSTGEPICSVLLSFVSRLMKYRREGLVPVMIGHNVMFDW